MALAVLRCVMRDALVFKSIVGLLSSRTSVQWEHILSGAPDLLILGDQSAADNDTLRPTSSCVVLKLLHEPQSHTGLTIHLPLKPQEVLERLEAASRLLREPSKAQSNPSYRLNSWPPARLLQGRAELQRAAALLNARALTQEQLQAHTGMPSVQCSAFIEALKHAGVLGIEQGEPAPVAPEPERKGFFARLRAHLGLTHKSAGR